MEAWKEAIMPEAAFTKSDEAKAFISLTLFHGTILMKRLGKDAVWIIVQLMQKFSVGTNSLPQQFVCSWALWHLRFVVPGNEHVSKWMKQFNRISVRKDTLGTFAVAESPKTYFPLASSSETFSSGLSFYANLTFDRRFILLVPDDLLYPRISSKSYEKTFRACLLTEYQHVWHSDRKISLEAQP